MARQADHPHIMTKYLPPNCAPTPSDCVIFNISCSISRSRKALPSAEPWVAARRDSAPTPVYGFHAEFAEVPPITIAK